MNNLFTKLKMIEAFITLVRNPLKTEKIFAISDLGRERQAKEAEKILKPILENERFQTLWKEGYNPMIEMNALRQLPDATFGNAVAKFLDKNGFDANGFPRVEAQSGLGYLSARMRQTHDQWHVLTGYEANVKDEIALQAFVMAQINSPLSAVIITGGLLHTMFYHPSRLIETIAAVAEGYTRGRKSKNLLTERLEDYWSSPLTEVRARLSLNA